MGQTANNASGPRPPRIPDYELLKQIGEGSYGAVWLARGVTGVYHAIKIVFRDRFSSDHPFDREFAGIRHYEGVSRSHSGLVAILHVGKDDEQGFFYYVMELADDLQAGTEIEPDAYTPHTLRQDLKAGRMPARECALFALSLSWTLTHLHEQGLVHRDLKPSSVIFVNGSAKLADIGLVADAGESQSFVGTEGYIPPEGPGTPSGDVYALGKVIYEMSTGLDRLQFPEWPSGVKDEKEVAWLQGLNAVVLKACESDPGKRFHTAEELHAALRDLQAGRPAPAKRERAWATAAVVLVLLAASLGTAAWLWRKPDTAVVAASGEVSGQEAPNGSAPAHPSPSDTVQGRRVRPDASTTLATGITGEPVPTGSGGEALSPRPVVAHAVLDGALKRLAEDNPEVAIADSRVEMKTEGIKLDLSGLTALSNISALSALPVTELDICSTAVADLEPLRGMALEELDAGRTAIENIAPLAEAPLRSLSIRNTEVTDLTPLRGMPLSRLDISFTTINDLTPLQGAPLEWLRITGNQGNISDLSALAGAPLSDLAWHGICVRNLGSLRDFPLTRLNLCHTRVRDLSPLKGMQLTHLNLEHTPVADISPLRSLPLTNVDIAYTRVTDVSPLEDAPLLRLDIRGALVRDLSPVQDIPDLRIIGIPSATPGQAEAESELSRQDLRMKAEAALSTLRQDNPEADITAARASVSAGTLHINLSDLYALRDVSALRGLPITHLDLSGTGVESLEPLSNLPLVDLDISCTSVLNLTPLASCPIRSLRIHNTNVCDLSPLEGMRLVQLDLRETPVSDLSPLAGMPIQFLKLGGDRGCVTDLTTLQGMPIEEVVLSGLGISDLGPLQGMPLRMAYIGSTSVRDLAPLAGAPIETLRVVRSPVSDLSPLKGMPIKRLNITGTQVADLSPLQGMPLILLDVRDTPVTDLSPVEHIQGLELLR